MANINRKRQESKRSRRSKERTLMLRGSRELKKRAQRPMLRLRQFKVR